METLAKGAALTPETFADFVTRLRHHCRGEGVDWHCTADAMFTVQAKKRTYGVDRDYTDKWAVCLEDQSWLSPQAYWDDLDDEEKASLDEAAQNAHECAFLDLSEYQKWDLLGELDDHTVTGYEDEWEHVCSHFTKEAADAFIQRKKHDYRLGLRVYVDAQTHCWEWNAIKEALMDGRLVLAAQQGKEGA
ncbi:hypothetical protein [Chitinilyticum aquatile]|uniref:hypothetical protein n=1 Tax=Chitinilyticum aquatile TaxID=362520 RepID=UPI00055552A5|nr:hypothetical protein [Chitinilyticum aquatile]